MYEVCTYERFILTETLVYFQVYKNYHIKYPYFILCSYKSSKQYYMEIAWERKTFWFRQVYLLEGNTFNINASCFCYPGARNVPSERVHYIHVLF